MKELSVFVDESGDFGEYDHRAPFYIISLVLHDQDIDITEDLTILEAEMKNIGWPDHCVHAGPINGICKGERIPVCDVRN